MTSKEMWVLCGDCEHKWIAVHLPMTIEKVGRIMRRLICPKCAQIKKIFMCEGLFLENRIEVLEAALAKIDRSECLHRHDICEIARAALTGIAGEKKDEP